ncbi:hypothetical protein DH86_00003762, partial [Scytalidium sp. 3C]
VTKLHTAITIESFVRFLFETFNNKFNSQSKQIYPPSIIMGFRGQWQPQFVQYNAGDVVEYQGHYYEIIQAHASQAGWEPPKTPALWKGVDGPGGGAANPPPGNQWQGIPGAEGGPHEEKHWYDMDDHKKNELLLGGGLALGLGLLGGGMYYAHEKHEKEKDREALAFELQNWVLAAHKHTEEFFQNGPQGPVTWILNDAFPSNPHLLDNAIRGGDEKGKPLYICRAPYHVKKYEVLIGDQRAIHWERVRGQFNPSSLQSEPVVGGHDTDNTRFYIARVVYKDAQYPAQCSERSRGATFCYDDDEKSSDDYEVLCYSSRR